MGRKRKCVGSFDIDYPASYIDTNTGKQVQYHWYTVWQSITAKVGKYEHYTDVSMSDEFLSLKAFHLWYKEQEVIHKCDIAKLEIDKDILAPKSRIYSRETCVFVPDWLNLQFIDRSKFRGKYALGAAIFKKGFMSNITDGSGKGKIYLGYYPTELEAHRAWQQAKIRHLEGIVTRSIECNMLGDNLDKVIQAIRKRIDKIQTDYDNKRITTSINFID